MICFPKIGQSDPLLVDLDITNYDSCFKRYGRNVSGDGKREKDEKRR